MGIVRNVAGSPAITAAFIVAMIAASAAVGTQLFAMRLSGALGLYFVVWWTLLFAVLPFGVRSQVEEGEVVSGTEPGAPAAPLLVEKAIWTTIVASVVFTAAAALLPVAGL
jgi:predicted secreted protein